jgi:acyl carrier protein
MAESTTLEWTTFLGHVTEFLGVEPESVGRATHIYNELGIDSLGMFSLGMHVLKCFDIRLPLSEVATIATLGDLYDALDRHRPCAS